MSIIQSDKTAQFIKHVQSLKDTGKINKFVEIIDALGWDKTSLSMGTLNDFKGYHVFTVTVNVR